jgi:hypothetical protein
MFGTENTDKILKRYHEEEILNTITYLTYALQFKCYSEEDKEAMRESMINLSKSISEQ